MHAPQADLLLSANNLPVVNDKILESVVMQRKNMTAVVQVWCALTENKSEKTLTDVQSSFPSA